MLLAWMENPRLKELQGIFNSIPGLTVNWSAVHMGSGSSPASNAEYKVFLGKSTKDSLTPDTSLRIRVDVTRLMDAAGTLCLQKEALRRGASRPVQRWRRSTAS
jgi:hypothetical protein